MLLAKNYTLKDGYPDFFSGVSDTILIFALLFAGSLILLLVTLLLVRKHLLPRKHADDNSNTTLHLP